MLIPKLEDTQLFVLSAAPIESKSHDAINIFIGRCLNKLTKMSASTSRN